MNKTPLIVSGLAAALVAGGGSSAYAMTHEVTVDAYGTSTSSRLLSGTVGDALKNQGVDVKATDAVSPALSTPVSGDTHISVKSQRPVTVTYGGTTTTYLTSATTVGEALAAYELPETAKISLDPATALSEDGTDITVSVPREVTFTGQYGKWTHTFEEPTVGAIAAAHIGHYEEGDRFYDEDGKELSGSTAVTDGMTVRIERVRTKKVTSTKAIDYDTTTRKDSDLAEGTTKVITEGKKGKRTVVTQVTTVDGKVTKKKVLSKKVTTKAVDEVVAKGTKKVAAQSSSSSSSSSSKSSSSKSSSSSSSSSKSSSGGKATGAATTCRASFYGRGDGTDGGPTASGERFNSEAMTAAHKTLPLGTRIRVTNKSNGQSVVVRINDRGPYISGRCLDLSAGAFDAIGNTGAGTMTVTIQRVS